MADTRYIIEVNAAGAVTAVEKLDKAFDKLHSTGKATPGIFSSMTDSVKQMAVGFATGQFIVDGLRKAFGMLKNAIASSIAGAAEEEDSVLALTTALELTGRAVDSNRNKLMDFAKAQMAASIYTHEQIESVETLFVQMTKLDAQGIQRATKGVMGLAAVMKMDLDSAARMVMKAMEGNYAALSRVGIRVEESLSPMEKQASLLSQLDKFYGRVTAEASTFSGSMKQLKVMFGEIGDELGNSIVKNADFRAAIKSVHESIIALIESGKLAEWAALISANISSAIGMLQTFSDMMKGLASGAGPFKKLAEDITGMTDVQNAAIEGARTKILDFQKSLKVLTPTFDELAIASESGRWDEYVAWMKALDAQMLALKPAAAALVAELTASLKPAVVSLTEDFKTLGIKGTAEVVKQLELTKKTLDTVLKQGGEAPGVIEALKKKVAELTEVLYPGQKAWDDNRKAMEEFLTSAQANFVPTISAMAAEVRGVADAFTTLGNMIGGALGGVVDFKEDSAGFGEELSAGADTSIRHLTRMEYALRSVGKAVETIKSVTDTAFASMNEVFSQAQRNREIGIENEYKKRLAAINKNIKDEAKRQAAVVALEAEFQIKRSSAAAAGAKQAKAVALMEAIVNTASGVARAFKDYAFPFSAVVAGIVGALGAVQIALIAKQPIPLAKGAYFNKPTLLGRGSYEVAEAHEPEFVLPESKLKAAFRDVAQSMFPAAGTPAYAMAGAGGITVNINSPLVHTVGLSQGDMERAGDKMFQVIERQLRLRGRR